MILWKELDCPNYNDINAQINMWVDRQDWIHNPPHFWNPVDIKDFFKNCPEFYRWLIASDLKLRSLAITVAHSIHSCPIHIDTPPARYKLSWPVRNTKGTWNRWFKNLNSATELNQLGGIHFLNHQNLVEISRREVISPSLIDAGVPHDVWFDESPVFPRIGLQCQLFKEPKTL